MRFKIELTERRLDDFLSNGTKLSATLFTNAIVSTKGPLDVLHVPEDNTLNVELPIAYTNLSHGSMGN